MVKNSFTTGLTLHKNRKKFAFLFFNFIFYARFQDYRLILTEDSNPIGLFLSKIEISGVLLSGMHHFRTKKCSAFVFLDIKWRKKKTT